jgi:PAS domain-containing protein
MLVFFLIVGSVLTTWYLAVLLNRKAIADKAAVSMLRKTDQKEIADYKYALDESAIVAITDQKGIIQYVNQNFCNITGYTDKGINWKRSSPGKFRFSFFRISCVNSGARLPTWKYLARRNKKQTQRRKFLLG